MSGLRIPIFITFLASNGATVVNFLVSIVLARLLTPEEIGIYSIAAVLVVIAHIFRDFGIGSYLLQEKELTPEKIRSAGGILFTTSWFTALVLYFLSGYAADYYHRPEVKNVIQVLALGFVFIPFGAITHTLLTRELRAREQAIASIFGIVVFAVSSVVMAYAGFSYMTMAWANFFNILANAIALFPYRPSYAPWLPSFKGWRKAGKFGSGALLGNSLYAINNTIPDMVLGKVSGAHAAGIYSRAASTTNLFNQIAGPAINYAVIPHLSKTHHTGHSVVDPLKKGIAYLSVAAWPALAATAIFAREIILVLYGNQWVECITTTRILCIWMVMTIPVYFNGPALISIGKPYMAALPAFTGIVIKLSLVYLFFDGALDSFAYIILLAMLINLPVHYFLMKRYFAIGSMDYFSSLKTSGSVTIIIVFLLISLAKITEALVPALQLLIATVICGPAWILLVRFFRHPLHFELLSIGKRFPRLSVLIGKE